MPHKPWRRVVVRRRPAAHKKRAGHMALDEEGSSGETEQRRVAKKGDLSCSSSSSSDGGLVESEEEVVAGGQKEAEGEDVAKKGEEAEKKEGKEEAGDKEVTEEGAEKAQKEDEAKEGEGSDKGGESEGKGAEAVAKPVQEEEDAWSPAAGGADRFANFFRRIKPARSPEDEEKEEGMEEEEKELSYTNWEQSPWLSMTQGVDRHFEAMRVKKINKKAEARKSEEQPPESSEEDEEEQKEKHTLFTGRSVLTPSGVYDSVLARIRAKTSAVDRRALADNDEAAAADAEGGLLIDSIPVYDHPRPGEVLSPLLKERPEEPEEEEDKGRGQRPRAGGARKRFF